MAKLIWVKLMLPALISVRNCVPIFKMAKIITAVYNIAKIRWVRMNKAIKGLKLKLK